MPLVWINRFIAVLLIGLSIWLYVEAGGFPMGADFFPKVILGAIVFLSLLLFLQSLICKRKPATGTWKPPGTGNIRPYLVFGLCLVYIGSMHLIGFFPGTGLAGLLFMPVLGVQRRGLYLSILAGVMVFIYFFFFHLLHVPLPKGVLLR